jgi:hypothetical protein
MKPAIGRLTQNIGRHPASSVSAPPRRYPLVPAAAPAALHTASALRRSAARGAAAIRRRRAAGTERAAESPCRHRPTISGVSDSAVAQSGSRPRTPPGRRAASCGVQRLQSPRSAFSCHSGTRSSHRCAYGIRGTEPVSRGTEARSGRRARIRLRQQPFLRLRRSRQCGAASWDQQRGRGCRRRPATRARLRAR